jgi:hypothetical protein
MNQPPRAEAEPLACRALGPQRTCHVALVEQAALDQGSAGGGEFCAQRRFLAAPTPGTADEISRLAADEAQAVVWAMNLNASQMDTYGPLHVNTQGLRSRRGSRCLYLFNNYNVLVTIKYYLALVSSIKLIDNVAACIVYIDVIVLSNEYLRLEVVSPVNAARFF